MLCPEAGTNPRARGDARAPDRATGLTRAFTGRLSARGSSTASRPAHSIGAPSAYPGVPTSRRLCARPRRAEAADAESFNLWAGQAHALDAGSCRRPSSSSGSPPTRAPRSATRGSRPAVRSPCERQHASPGGRHRPGLPRPQSYGSYLAARPAAERPAAGQQSARTTTRCCSSSSTRPPSSGSSSSFTSSTPRRPPRRATTSRAALKRIARVKHIQQHADRAVVGARDADADRVRRSSVARSATASGFQSLPVPGGRVRARQQERRDARGLRHDPDDQRCSPSCSTRRASTTSSCAILAAPGLRSRSRCWTAT